MKLDKIKWLFVQIYKDIIGKDSHRGITLTYSWLANQFGHFSLGFIPASLLIYHKEDITWCNIALIVSLGWLLYEVIIVVISLRKYIFTNHSTFNPKWNNILFDTATDIGYFTLGAFTGTLLFSYTFNNLVVVFIILLLLIYPFYYWYLTKIFQQYAFYPYQLRLCQWDSRLDDNYKSIIFNFMALNDKGLHLLIIGEKDVSNSKLGIGIANELSIQHNTCLYTSAVKLVNIMISRHQIQNKLNKLWSWKSSKFLVIDDVDSDKILQNPSSDSKNSIKFTDEHNKIILSKKDLISKNIIWILSSDDSNRINTNHSWIKKLESAGANPEKIFSVVVD